MQLNTKAKTWRRIKRYKKQPVAQRNRLHHITLSARSSHSSCTVTSLFLPRQQWHRDVLIQIYTTAAKCYSKVQQPWKQGLDFVGFFPPASFSFPFKLLPWQKWIITHQSAVTLHLPSTTSHLPSSGPAEAPSESIPCSSPVSELFSRPPDCAPSVRHPLEFDLKEEFRRNTKTHVRNSALTQLWKQILLVPYLLLLIV